MALVSCCPVRWSGNAGYNSTEVDVVWKVVMDDGEDGPITTMAAAQSATPGTGIVPIPAIYGAYAVGNDSDATMRLENIVTDEPTEHHVNGVKLYTWLLTCQYRTRPPGILSCQDFKNPLLRCVTYWMESREYTRPALIDVLTGDPVANSADQPFDPPYEIEEGNTILVARRNESDLAAIIATGNAYNYSTNSGTFYGAAAGYVRMLPILCSQPISENGVDYYQVEYRFEFGWEPWNLRPLDQGTKYIDSSGKLKQAGDGVYGFSEPVNLNGVDGKLQAVGTPGVFLDGGETAPSSGIFRRGPFSVRRVADFSLLGL